MRVLVIAANRYRHPYPVPPFGAVLAAWAARQAGHEVRVCDLAFARDPAAALARTVADFRPHVAGLSLRNIDNGTGWQPRYLLEETRQEVVTPLRRIFSGLIVCGGPAVAIAPAAVLEFLGLEWALRGQAEAEFPALLARLEHIGPDAAQRPESAPRFGDLPGLVRRTGGRVAIDNPAARPETAEMAAWPAVMPTADVDPRPYLSRGAHLPVRTKTGCALACVYCTYNAIEGRAYRCRAPRAVARAIAETFAATGIDRFEFVDATFNLPLPHAKAVLAAVAGLGLPLRLRCMGLNPSGVDAELARLMRRAGFVEADLGVEALCDETLAGLNKTYDAAGALTAAHHLREAGIPAAWFLLLGAPGETEATARHTLATACREAGPRDMVIAGVGIRAYPGAPIARLMAGQNDGEARNLLAPVGYEPRSVSLSRLRQLAGCMVREAGNLYLYGDAGEQSGLIERLAMAAQRRWLPGSPTWAAWLARNRLARAFRRLPAQSAGLPAGPGG